MTIRQLPAGWTAKQHGPEVDVVIACTLCRQDQRDNLKASFEPEDRWLKSFKMQTDRNLPPS